MSEVNSYPEFYIPVESIPTLGPEQLAETRQAFNELFDDLILQGMDRVQNFESIKGRPTADLLTHIEKDGHTYTLSLIDRGYSQPNNEVVGITLRASEVTSRDISIQRIAEGYGREFWSYRLGSDGTVRRWDGGDARAKSLRDRELGLDQQRMLSGDETIEEIGKVALTNIQNIINDIPNSRLSEDIGLNRQPVAPDEINGLKDFISNAVEIPGIN